MSSNVSAAHPPSSPAAPWQALLALASVLMASVVVGLPVGALLLLGWAGLLAIAGAATLNAVGALDPGSVLYGLLISAVLLGIAGVLATGNALSARVPRSRGHLSPGLPRQTPRSSWIARHPWLFTFAIAAFIDGCLAPLEAAHTVSVPGAIVAAGVFTGGVLLFFFVAYASARIGWMGVRGLRTAARRSSFVAGVVSTGSLLVTLAALLVGRAVTQSANALAALAPARPAPTCKGAPLDCMRAALTPPPAIPGPGGAGLVPSRLPSDQFDDCIEELHREDPERGNAYGDALKQAKRRLYDRDEAINIVQDTLITVCLGAGRLGDVRSYFIRSVTNNVGKVARRNRQHCPLDPDDPDWPVDRCVARSAEQLYLQREMDLAMHDAMCLLTADEQTVIQLHAVDGLSHRDVSLQLGCSEAAASQRYSRAIKRLRERFDARCK